MGPVRDRTASRTSSVRLLISTSGPASAGMKDTDWEVPPWSIVRIVSASSYS